MSRSFTSFASFCLSFFPAFAFSDTFASKSVSFSFPELGVSKQVSVSLTTLTGMNANVDAQLLSTGSRGSGRYYYCQTDYWFPDAMHFALNVEGSQIVSKNYSFNHRYSTEASENSTCFPHKYDSASGTLAFEADFRFDLNETKAMRLSVVNDDRRAGRPVPLPFSATWENNTFRLNTFTFPKTSAVLEVLLCDILRVTPTFSVLEKCDETHRLPLEAL